MPAPLLLSSLPLFPLSSVLYPDGSLNLQIFEVRYLDLIGKCRKTGAPFGVVSLLQGREVRQPDTSQPTGNGFAIEQFADVGTLATVVDAADPQPGLMVVRCTAGVRFRITQRRQLKHGLWVADVALMPADIPTAIPDDLLPVAQALGSVIQNLQSRGIAPEHMPVPSPYLLDDCGWVANRWCELLTLPPAHKQGLMQLDNPLLRLELVGDFLNKGGITP
jgi:uncharacterized protein